MIKKTICTLFLTFMTSTLNAAEITISAAASLTDAFTKIAAAYEKENPTDKVHLNFASSGVLLQQILNGAPVDVFASADQLSMDKAEQVGVLRPNSRHDFAGNTLVAIIPSGESKNYANLTAFLHDEAIKRLAIANPEHVPAGRYSKQALEQQQLWEKARAKMIPTQNVRQALDYVVRGEVDGGFVYQTDAALMGEKVQIVLQVPLLEPVTYPIAVLKKSKEKEAALNFMTFVQGKTGKEILHHYGFSDPDSWGKR